MTLEKRIERVENKLKYMNKRRGSASEKLTKSSAEIKSARAEWLSFLSENP